ncbi:hypothetical protein CPAV1605_713 [seawater metagenome]|uniref:Uncharacterized protein n=1 Tax=seawater metagenome TaxID=1561972 RepID=A0A5E8CHV7_9ZZZZ
MATIYSSKNIRKILESDDDLISTEEVEDFKTSFQKINFIIQEFTAILCNDTLKYDGPFLISLQERINNHCGSNVSKKQVFKLMQEFIKRKDSLKKLVCNKKEDKQLEKYMTSSNFTLIGAGYQQQQPPMTPEEEEKWRNFKPSFIQKFMGWHPGTKFFPTKILDIVALILDIIGFIPVEGEISDAAALLLNVVRGNWIDVMFNVIDLIPMVGSFIGVPGKYIHKFMTYEKRIKEFKEMTGDASQVMSYMGPSNQGPPPPPQGYGPPGYGPPGYGPPGYGPPGYGQPGY